MDQPIVYVIRLTNTDMTHYDEQITAHVAWVNAHVERTEFLLCGPLEDRTKGGMIVAHAPSRDALDRILRDDPFLVHGIATHEVLSFVVTRGHNLQTLQTEVAS